MIPADLDRYGCTLNGRRLTYAELTRHYVCDECGGRLVHSFVRAPDGGTTDRVFCGECGGEDVVSQRQYDQQVADGHEVLRSLPDDLRALLEPEREQVNAEQAIEDLFG